MPLSLLTFIVEHSVILENVDHVYPSKVHLSPVMFELFRKVFNCWILWNSVTTFKDITIVSVMWLGTFLVACHWWRMRC